MEKETYWKFRNNGRAEKGTRWRKCPVRNMRNAYIKVFLDDSVSFKGRIYYQTATSDSWVKEELSCSQGQQLYKRIYDQFIPCTTEEFLEYTKDGFDLRSRVLKEWQTKQSSITYVNNKFIYTDHVNMIAEEKRNYYLKNFLFWYTAGYKGGLNVRSFIIAVEEETDYYYKTRFHFLPTGEENWKCMEKRFKKSNLEEAYVTGLIEETSDYELAKYSLVSNPVPKKCRRTRKKASEVYDSFDLKNKIINLNSKTLRAGTILEQFSVEREGVRYSFIKIISNITEKSVIITKSYDGEHHRDIVAHEDFALKYCR